MRNPSRALVIATIAASLLTTIVVRAQQAVFKGGVDVVNVTATVTDGDGRFISGLRKEDFVIYDDGKPQEIVSFNTERVPVSLGLLLDVSGSMSDDRMALARSAINRFVFDLLGSEDELFLMEFTTRGRMLQTWTKDRDTFSRALGRANKQPMVYGTAVYDAVAHSVPVASEGLHTKKALLILSDGMDNTSRREPKEVQETIRRSEVLVYALAVGAEDDGPWGDGVDAGALRGLRKLTDDTGGRTEVVKGFRNLDKATAKLADELNQQYVLSYAAPSARDGRWHNIKVEVRKRGSKVRARAGYIAS